MSFIGGSINKLEFSGNGHVGTPRFFASFTGAVLVISLLIRTVP